MRSRAFGRHRGGAHHHPDRRRTFRLLRGRVVDLVFAKAGLREHCQANGIVHLPYADFAEVTRLLAERLPNLGAAGLADLPTHAPSGAFLGQEKQAALLEAGIPGRVLP